MANSKSWPQKGDKYFYVSDDLCVGHGTVTDDVYSDAYERQTARLMAGNFFESFEDAKEMADKVVELFAWPHGWAVHNF